MVMFVFVSLYNAVLGLNAEVAVVRASVCVVDVEGRKCVKCLGVLFPEQLSHVEAVHHLTLTTLLGLLKTV